MRARRVLLALFLLVAPAARAQVGADWTAATGGSIRPGHDLNPCSATNSGALRYNTTVSQFQVCYGSGNWVKLADASGTVPAAADRIISGTTSLLAVSSTGFVNLTQAGTNTGWFDPTRGLVTLGVSATGTISGTTGYFSGNVGFGNAYPSTAIETAGVIHVRDPGTPPDNNYNGALRITRPTSAAQYINMVKHGMFVWSLGMTYNTTNFAIGMGAPTDSSFNNPFFVITTIGRVGIGTTNPNANLEVVGTVSATSFRGDGSGLTGVVASTADRIVSGSNQVTINSNGIVSITQAGINWAYIHPSLGFVGPGFTLGNLGKTINHSPQEVFTYNGQTMSHYGIGWFSDSTNGWNLSGPTAWLAAFGGIKFFTSGTPRMVVAPNGYVGIGTTNPNANLEVVGTVSATSFRGDGSALTGVGGIPSGAILAFDLASCPSGWSEYVQARGRFLRGIDNGAGNDPAGTRPSGSIQDDTLQNITGTIAAGTKYGNVAGTGVFGAPVAKNSPIFSGSPVAGYISEFDFDASRVARTSIETRPKNVAVLYCRKN